MSIEQIKAKLSECYKEYQPVLLYGKRTFDVRAFVENIRDGVSIDLGYIDCHTMDGEEFYNELARYHEAGRRTNSGSAYSQSGTLFIDNLHYYPKKKNEDEDVYNKAGKIIRNRKLTILSASPHFDPFDGFADNNDVYVNYESYAVVTHYDVDWIVAYTDKPNAFPKYFRRQFKVISLDSENDEGEQQEDTFDVSVSAIEESKPERQPQEVESIETTLSYNKTTGKFRFGSDESVPISPTPRHKVRGMAEKLMQCWAKGKPCPQSKIVRDPTKKTPRSVYDNTTTIRNSLKSYLKVNMPQSSNDEYLPPEEPKHFKIVS